MGDKSSNKNEDEDFKRKDSNNNSSDSSKREDKPASNRFNLGVGNKNIEKYKKLRDQLNNRNEEKINEYKTINNYLDNRDNKFRSNLEIKGYDSIFEDSSEVLNRNLSGGISLQPATKLKFTKSVNDKKQSLSELTVQEKSLFDEILEYYSDVSIGDDSLYSIFQEYQYSKTKGSKKFLFTVSFLLTFGFFTGIDLSDMSFFGTETSSLNPNYLIFTLLFILVISSLHYFFHNKRDKQLHDAKLQSINGELKQCLLYKTEIEKLAVKADANDVENLMAIKLTTGELYKEDSPLNVYYSISHYDDNLKEPANLSQILSKSESIGLYFLTFTSITFIAENLFLSNDVSVDIVWLYFPVLFLLVAVFYQIYKS